MGYWHTLSFRQVQTRNRCVRFCTKESYCFSCGSVKYPYLDISLLDAGVSLRRRTKALKGKEEYPVHILTNNFMNYIGL